MILRGQHLTFDALPSPFTLSEVSFTYLNATFHQRLNALPLTEKDLQSFGLITGDGHLTYAGALLCDQPVLDQSKIFCTSWKGLSKGTVGETAFDDKEYAGNLISMLETAELFVSVNSKKSWGISGFFRDEHEEYPGAAVREALINAVIHRDYLISGSEVHVDIFPDRLEITSPGGMVDGSFIQKRDPRDVPSKRRNKVISDIFSRLHIMERRGSGLTRILDAYAASGKVPVFYSDESTFRVTLPSLSYHPASTASAAETAGSGGEAVLSDEERILRLITENPSITMKEMSDVSGLSLKTVRTILQSLRETGVVERVGSQKSGFWNIR